MKKKLFVTVKGGLGNQLFIFFAAYHYATTNNLELIPLRSWYSGWQRGFKFSAHRREFLLDYIVKSDSFTRIPLLLDFSIYYLIKFLVRFNLLGKKIMIEKTPLYNPRITNPNYHILDGYFQSEKYFNSNIRKCLKANSVDIRSYLSDLKIKQEQRVVAIHVRREDTLIKGNDWTGLLDMNYYKKAICEIDHLQDKAFVVFSDSPEWCKKQNFFKEINAYIINEPDPVKTLLLMISCDDFVIAGSTLSWMGAWISNSPEKIVVAPKPFFKKRDSRFEKDLVPKEWIRSNASFY